MPIAPCRHTGNWDDEPLATIARRSAAQRLAKCCFDIVAALAALVLLSPLLVVIALAIRRDDGGPILFRQIREGRQRGIFTILKFRTMAHRRNTAFEQAHRNDPRVTWIGAYLRAVSFDELPQLLNVLRGSLSLVGPRPHVPELSARYAAHIEGYYERLLVRPGITGLAQINGERGETRMLAQMAARVHWDRIYVRTWSVAGDLAICVRTLLIPLGQDRAY
jgi:lipopolysaccharide/colanic/teichoic acid biosynthesis glycosyltransferase